MQVLPTNNKKGRLSLQLSHGRRKRNKKGEKPWRGGGGGRRLVLGDRGPPEKEGGLKVRDEKKKNIVYHKLHKHLCNSGRFFF